MMRGDRLEEGTADTRDPEVGATTNGGRCDWKGEGAMGEKEGTTWERRDGEGTTVCTEEVQLAREGTIPEVTHWQWPELGQGELNATHQ